ncbi:MAG: methyl-accepting chemotaxis protein, partial [Elusimicrobiota bacterium]
MSIFDKISGNKVVQGGMDKGKQEELNILRQIYGNMNSTVRVIDRDYKVKMTNPAMEELSGISNEQAAGMKCSDHLKNKYCGTEECSLKQILGGRERVEIEIDIRDSEGKDRVMEYSVFPLKDRKGRVAGMIEICTDVTELREAQKEVEEISMELSMGIARHFEVLKKIGRGEIGARTTEESDIEILGQLGKVINQTAEELEDNINRFQDISMGISEIFGVIKKVTEGDYSARAPEESEEGLLGQMGVLINKMIVSIKDMQGEMEETTRELSMGIAEHFEVLRKIGKGDPSARTTEESEVEVIGQLGKVINQTAVSIGESVEEFHELAMGITALFSVIKEISEGNLMVTASEQGGEELLVQMGMMINTMVDKLRELVMKIKEQSDTVALSSTSLAEISDQSKRTISQLSSTMQQVSQATSEVAKNSQEAAKISSDVDEATKQGRSTMKDLLDKIESIQDSIKEATRSMEELAKRSGQISEIVEVITKIAEQTNLLSLNAAIEAARAGEAGKGFAVVADEVRNLAKSSTQQAQEISNIIQQVLSDTEVAVSKVNTGAKGVEEGRELVDRAHSIFLDLSSNIEKVANQIEEIAGATEETAAGAEEVTAASEEQTAAVKEMASSSGELSEAAINLKKSVESFRVEEVQEEK